MVMIIKLFKIHTKKRNTAEFVYNEQACNEIKLIAK